MFRLSKSRHVNFARLFHGKHRLHEELPHVKRRRRVKRLMLGIEYISASFVLLAVLAVIFLSVHYVNIKTIHDNMWSGRNELMRAINAFEYGDFPTTRIAAKRSHLFFSLGLSDLIGYKDSYLISNFNTVNLYYEDLANLVGAANILSQALNSAADYGENITAGDTPATSSPDIARTDWLRRIHREVPELIGIKANIRLSLYKLDKIRYRGLFLLLKNDIEMIKEKLRGTEAHLEKSIKYSQWMPQLSGYPKPARYLLVIQNSDNLWPTGGRITACGEALMEDGRLKELDLMGIAGLDQRFPAGFNKRPPSILQEYTEYDQWLPSQANWSPHWPLTAGQIAWFYEMSTGREADYDGIIALNSGFLLDLERKIGSDHSVSSISGSTDMGDPEKLEEILRAGFDYFSDQQVGAPFHLFDLLRQNLEEKNILLYMDDEELQESALERGWAGSIGGGDDFVALVEADMTESTTGEKLGVNVEYRLTESENDFRGQVTINLSLGDKEEPYRGYLRAYLPLGSRIIKTEIKSPGRVLLPSRRDVSIYNELGKTVCGIYHTQEPNTISSIVITYDPPGDIGPTREEGRYRLNIRKQPGCDIRQLTVDLSYQNRVKSYEPTGFHVYREGTGRVRWETNLGTDRYFQVSF